MGLGDLDRKQTLVLAAAVGLILGLVAVPPLLQRYYGIDAVQAAFVIILFYAALNWWMKRK